MGFVQRRLIKAVIRVVSFPKLTLAVCAAVLAASIVFALTNLSLSTDQDELLTPKLKFFKDYKDFEARFPENASFVVILEPQSYAHPPPAARWIDLADRISARLMALTQYVKRVDSHVAPWEFGKQGLLFADWDEIKSASAHAGELQQFATIVGDPSALSSRILGGNMTTGVFRALSGGNAKDSKALATEVARSLSAAIVLPPDQWRHGIELPDLASADPRAATDPSIFGYNMVSDETKRGTPAFKTEKLLTINVYAKQNYSSLAYVTEPIKRMRAEVEEVGADFPEFKKPVITGRPALEADEMSTSDHDTRIAEILGLSLVFVVLFIFLKSLWLVIVAELCLGTGIGWTFGWATLSVGRLNLLSLVFVIALIGIGMDYLIQILMRYRFEKKRYARPQAIWARVFRFVSPPISTACFGAAGAFFAATLTNFRGAAELGLIAGGGLLLCLISGYTVLPALLTLFPASVGKVAHDRRYRHRDPHPHAGGLRLLPAALWILVAGLGLFLSLPPQFDPNLLKLQADNLESVKAVRKIQTWSAVVLSSDLEKLRQAREALAPRSPQSTIDRTESVIDAAEKRAWLVQNNSRFMNVNWQEPASPAVSDLHGISAAAAALLSGWQQQKDAGDLSSVKTAVAALTAVLNGTTPDQTTQLARIEAWQKAFLEEVRTNLEQLAPPPLDMGKLPAELRDHLISDDPAGGAALLYALYIYPKADLWEPGKLKDFVAEVEGRTPKDVLLTGIAYQLYYSTLEIRSAFLDSTLYALVLIFILVLLDLRNLTQTMLAISVLALGLPMLLLMMWIWRVWLLEPLGIPGNWNFANFFALPILIGAGHEYGVFMVHRYRETLHDPRRVWRPWDVSDRALLLCGIVTSASFGFLIAAKHHGLASLGWVMAVGTACIYLSALLVLRPILQWQLKRKGIYLPVDEEFESASDEAA